jgi:hypothetical protein
MPIEILEGRRLTPESTLKSNIKPTRNTIQPNVQSQAPMGILDQLASRVEPLKRVGIATGLGALENLEGLANLLTYPAQAYAGFPKLSPFSEQLKEQFNLTPEYLEPRNFSERFVQKLGSQLPFAVAGGGIPIALGAGVGSLLGHAGAPEAVQNVGELATALGTGFAGNRIPTISSRQKAEDLLMRQAVPSAAKIKSPEVRGALKTVENALSTEAREKVANKIRHALGTVEKNLTKEKINPIDAADLRKSLYKVGRELSEDDAALYIQPLTKGINNFFANYAAENPSFYKHLTTRDKFTELKHMSSLIDKFGDAVSNVPKLGPAVNKLIKYTLGTTIGKTEKVLRSILTKPAGAKHYFEAVKAASKENPEAFIRALNNLRSFLPDNVIEDLPEEDIETTNKPSNNGIEILEGKKIV